MATRDARRGRQPRNSDPYLRYKIALIPVLLVILLYVLLGGEKKVAPAVQLVQPSASAENTTTLPQMSKTASRTRWPEGGLELLESANPFASYRSTGKPQDMKSRLVLQRDGQESDTDSSLSPGPTMEAAIKETLRAEPMRYLFESESRQVVMLGERILTQGDALNAKAKIERIEHGQLTLSPLRMPTVPVVVPQPELDASAAPIGLELNKLPNLLDLW